jgi:hypothetical protein
VDCSIPTAGYQQNGAMKVMFQKEGPAIVPSPRVAC